MSVSLGTVKRIFITAKRSESVTISTLETYERGLTRFIEYLTTDLEVLDISEVTAGTIRDYLISLQDGGLKAVTVHQHFRILRTMFLFLYREDYIPKNPMVNVKAPKVEQKEMRTFTSQEIMKILNAFNREDFIGMRNYCIMCLLFSTGIRKSELSDLTLADLNINNDLIRIANGKGQKERFAPIGKVLRRTLLKYLNMREEYLKGEYCQWVFVTPRDTRKLTTSCMAVLFQKLKKSLNITGEKVACHTWRHTFAKTYLLNGGDIFSLQKILGHADITTTKNYLHLNNKEMKNQHAKFNPLDNKDWLY